MENVEKEVDEMIGKKMEEDLEAKKKQLFFQEYRELVAKHGFDFFQQLQPPTIVKVSFVKPPEVKPE